MKRSLTLFILLFPVIALSADPAARPGWMGFGFTHHSEGQEQWLIVRAVAPGGPAAAAGIEAGDVITAIDGKPIRFKDSVALLEALSLVKPGQRVKFAVTHKQRKSTRVLTAKSMTDEQYDRWKTNLEQARQARDGAKLDPRG